MKLTKLYDPKNGQLQVAGLMSGSGTNLRKIIGLEKSLANSSFHVCVIFSDNAESNAVKIGREFDIPVIVRDIKEFYAAQGKPLKDLQVREEFDKETMKSLKQFNAKVAAYAGYMSIATKPLINAFLGINVHPGDLSKIDSQGKRKFVGGAHIPAMKAILAGEKELRSTTHIIEDKLDYGRILMLSPALKVELPENFNPEDKELLNAISKEHQGRLKEAGDWIVFPKTLQAIAEGKFSQDEKGKLYFEEKEIPQGFSMEKKPEAKNAHKCIRCNSEPLVTDEEIKSEICSFCYDKEIFAD
ncbi:MAG: formyltransferase family protein [Candidatus Diapherotrites archaeon]|nr:formyltransferase family protein [Candidatus Diapherotrites archaeon]